MTHLNLEYVDPHYGGKYRFQVDSELECDDMYLYEVVRVHEEGEAPWIFIVGNVETEAQAHLTLLHHMWRDPEWSAVDSWFLEQLHNDLVPLTPPQSLANGFGCVHCLRGPSLVLLAHLIRTSPTPYQCACDAVAERYTNVWSWATGDDDEMPSEWVDR